MGTTVISSGPTLQNYDSCRLHRKRVSVAPRKKNRIKDLLCAEMSESFFTEPCQHDHTHICPLPLRAQQIQNPLHVLLSTAPFPHVPLRHLQAQHRLHGLL